MSAGDDFGPDVGEAMRRARAASYAAGLAEGRRLAALEASVALKQLGLDLVAQAQRGEGARLLGNASGPGSLASVGGAGAWGR
jgi:hypothetical protein